MGCHGGQGERFVVDLTASANRRTSKPRIAVLGRHLPGMPDSSTPRPIAHVRYYPNSGAKAEMSRGPGWVRRHVRRSKKVSVRSALSGIVLHHTGMSCQGRPSSICSPTSRMVRNRD